MVFKICIGFFVAGLFTTAEQTLEEGLTSGTGKALIPVHITVFLPFVASCMQAFLYSDKKVTPKRYLHEQLLKKIWININLVAVYINLPTCMNTKFHIFVSLAIHFSCNHLNFYFLFAFCRSLPTSINLELSTTNGLSGCSVSRVSGVSFFVSRYFCL